MSMFFLIARSTALDLARMTPTGALAWVSITEKRGYRPIIRAAVIYENLIIISLVPLPFRKQQKLFFSINADIGLVKISVDI
jgi:hypothetical protein